MRITNKYIKFEEVGYSLVNQQLKRLGVDQSDEVSYSWLVIPFQPDFLSFYPAFNDSNEIIKEATILAFEDIKFTVMMPVEVLIAKLQEFQDNNELIFHLKNKE